MYSRNELLACIALSEVLNFDINFLKQSSTKFTRFSSLEKIYIGILGSSSGILQLSMKCVYVLIIIEMIYVVIWIAVELIVPGRFVCIVHKCIYKICTSTKLNH